MSSDVYSFHYFSLFIIICSGFCIHKSFADEDSSETGIILGEKCKKPEQCQNVTHNSTCSDGICVCADGFFQIQRINSSSCESDSKDKTDELYVGSPEPPRPRQQQVDLKMIIIMVVLAVMFIGICVALHMFSKARFWNHRTIFNSPHPRLMHIKLGKKKGRRRASHTSLEVPGSRQLSICSQLSPLQSRRGSQATSPEYIQKARKSNDGKREPGSHAHRAPKPDSSHKGASKADAPANVTNGPGSPTVIVSSNRGNTKPPNASARV
ncbi:uncharacterized protein LOC129960736 [Argiope bruennichi]|uniref:uncharacterized protein LOC129960736 n=1 Tax=Argiope bruennichi TaxID=94029 RepID=UPI002494F610|nr:uncharacterized protein LOC129960736 [Argiope bruennichi]